jgi:hypothetical protein
MKEVMSLMAAKYKNETYKAKTGSLRKEQQVFPTIQYNKAYPGLTDKQNELYLIQHKHMVEFLDKKGLIDSFNEWQKGKTIQAGDLVDWFKKWN